MESNFYEIPQIRQNVELAYEMAKHNNDAAAMVRALELAVSVSLHLPNS